MEVLHAILRSLHRVSAFEFSSLVPLLMAPDVLVHCGRHNDENDQHDRPDRPHRLCAVRQTGCESKGSDTVVAVVTRC